MSTKKTSNKRARSEDNNVIDVDNIIGVDDSIETERLIPYDTADEILNEHTKNAFEELLNNGKSDLLNLQVKNKGGSKLRSWIYNWGERKNHPTDFRASRARTNRKTNSPLVQPLVGRSDPPDLRALLDSP